MVSISEKYKEIVFEAEVKEVYVSLCYVSDCEDCEILDERIPA